MMHTIDDVATGEPAPKLEIVGRPRPGGKDRYAVLEEPGEPVLMHFRGKLVPHFKNGNCPNCGEDEPKPLWYVGAATEAGALAILELTGKCFRSAESAARFVGNNLPGPAIFRGLVVTIVRANLDRSPRVLRCEQRLIEVPDWPYETRRELARIWDVPMRPRLFKEA